MKTSQKPANNKLLIRYDNELKELLMQDLKAFRQKGPFNSNNRALTQQAA